MKRFLTWAGWILATPILLFLLLTFLLYLPPVQDFAVRKAASFVSEATGMETSVGKLRLRFPLDVDMHDFVACDAEGDTIAAASSVIVDLNLTQLLKWHVGVDGISLSNVHADTKQLIASVRVAGKFDELTLHDGVDLRSQKVTIDDIRLRQADVSILLRDTITPEDTTSTIVPWIIDVTRAEIHDSHVQLFMEADSLCIATDIHGLTAEEATIDLPRQLYNVCACEAAANVAYVAVPQQPQTLNGLTLAADSICFDGEAMHLGIAALVLRTPSSRLKGTLAMDISAFTPNANGRLTTSIDADFGRDDIALALAFADSVSLKPIATAWPDRPLHIELRADGNIDSLDVSRLDARMPGTLDLEAKATGLCLLDSVRRGGNIGFNVRSGDLAWLLHAVGADTRTLHLPPMELVGDAKANGNTYDLNARLNESSGSVRLAAKASLPGGRVAAMNYSAKGEVRNINVGHFLPRDSIGLVSAEIHLNGSGTDIYARSTRLEAEADVSQLQYGRKYDLSGIGLQASLLNSQARATLTSDNDILSCKADVAAMIEREMSGATFGLDLNSIDLHALGLSEKQLRVSACFHIDGTTDLRDSHSIDGTVTDIIMLFPDTLFRPEDVTIKALLRPDTVHVYASTGDLYVTIDTNKGYDRLLRQSTRFTSELQRQWQVRQFSLDALREEFPLAEIHLFSGTENPAHDILKSNGIDFAMVNMDLALSPVEGLNCGGQIYNMNAGGIQLDTVSLFAFQDTTGIELSARVRNGRRNPQIRFDARLNALLTDSGSVARLKYIDEQGYTGIDLGLQASIQGESLQLTLDPLNPIFAYRTYHANADNYFRLLKRNHIETNIKLIADDGTGINLYSSPESDALQDLTLGLQRINLGRLLSVIPYAPKISGMLDGDVHFVQHDTNISVSADINVTDFMYEKAHLGQVGVQAVYLPNADGSHFIDGSLLHTGMPVLSFGGTLGKANAKGAMSLDVDAALERFPVSLANGFIPDGMASLSGLLIGDVHVGGNTTRPDVNGAIMTNDIHLNSNQYSLSMRLEDDTLLFDNSQLTLSNLCFYSNGKAPLVVDGMVNFADTEKIRVDVKMSATNYELMNARKTTGALAYGKVYIDLTSQLRGTLDNLRMVGRLKVLADTDLTYVLADSPLSDTDQLEGLVEFVDFSDTLRVEEPVRTRPQHLNITLATNIDDAARLHCMLSPDGTNYVNLEGGGDLMLTYSPEKDLQLNGRYTVNGGTLKYTMMVIPLKEFTIKNGSYVEFRGPLMNPYLNLSATESLTTSITEYEESRTVSFNVGLSITQTLANMGLEFTIEAPEDQTVQSELKTMTKEQRARVAVTMLATGMYISDSSTAKGISTQNALNAFLQSQISNIAGKAIKSVDVSLGVTQGTSATGSTTTDYSFRLAKRFWNNRINVIIGGRVSTGADAKNTGQSILDNVTVEYRLDKSATRYVSLFYEKNHESLLDGEVTEMGGGIVLRRKSTKLGELFLFRKKGK